MTWHRLYGESIGHAHRWIRYQFHARKRRGWRSAGSELKQVESAEPIIENPAALKKRLESSHLSSKEKQEAVGDLARQFTDLNETRKELKAEVENQATPGRKVWLAVQKLARLIWSIFRGSFQQLWEFMIGLVGHDATDANAQRDIANQVQQNNGSWLRSLGNGLNTVVGWAWSAVWGSVKFLFYGVTKLMGPGFNLVSWVCSQPETARMSLIMANIIKRGMCRQIITWIQTSSKERTQFGLDESFFDFSKAAQRLAGPVVAKAASDVILQGGVKQLTSLAKTGLKIGFGLIPGIGSVLGVVSDMMVDSFADAGEEATKFYLHYNAVGKAFGEILDLFDPRPCFEAMQERQQELIAIMKSTSTEGVKSLTKTSTKKSKTKEGTVTGGSDRRARRSPARRRLR